MDFSNFIVCAVQGVGEFLPISSSAHMMFFEKILHIDNSSLENHVVLHAGSLIALLLYFLKDIISMVSGIWFYDIKKRNLSYHQKYRDLAWVLFVASIPTIITGFLVKKFLGSIVCTFSTIGILSIVFGVLMIISDSHNIRKKDIGFLKGFLVGLAQCLAVIPGASRLGLCLTMTRLLGIERVAALRFSLQLAIPILLGAFTLIVLDSKNIDAIFCVSNIAPTIIVSVLGIISIRLFLLFAESFSFKIFGIYRIIFGAILLYLF